MIVIPFTHEHLDRLNIQAAQEFVELGKAYAMKLDAEDSWTAMQGDTVLLCAGVIRAWPGRALAWALIGKEASAHFTAITRAVIRYMEMTPDRRVEAVTDSNFDQGHRWLKMLGFQHEGHLRLYTPDGRDVDIYSRVKNG